MLLALAAAGCAGGGAAPPIDDPRAEEPHAIPEVDLTRHSVPLGEVVLDTFDGDFVPLTRADAEVRERLRDRIQPLYRPGYGGPDGLSWLSDADLVLGYVSRGGAYAYPLKILNFRELVNDEIDGVPVLVSYCPLCASAVVYSRRLDGRTLLFGNTSALYESDLVMFDHETGSYWFQVRGEAIVGELTGARLRALPSTTTTWGDWKRLYPNTRLLVSDGGEPFESRYASDPFADYADFLNEGRFAFPVSRERLDARLRASEVVVTVDVGGQVKAYPPRLIGSGAVNDLVGGKPVVVFSRGDTAVASVFVAEVGDRELTFERRGHAFVDRQTSSTWTAAGEANAGPLTGARLQPLPSRRGFWFSIALAEPGVALYTG